MSNQVLTDEDEDEDRLAFVLRFRNRGGATSRWLERLYDTLFAHGSDLAEALGAEGDSDAGYTADAALKELEHAGWVIRGKYSPSLEQRFFGVGGLSGEAIQKKEQPFHPKLYGFSPNRERASRLHRVLQEMAARRPHGLPPEEK